MPRAAPPGWRSPPPVARSGAGPSPNPCCRSVGGPLPAAGVALDFAGPSRRACAACSARFSSPASRSAATAVRGAGRSEPIRRARVRRSPPCAGAWAAAARRSSSPSGAELLAPLRAATGKHATTTLRSHAGAEAVFPLPGALLGLVGPLHGRVPVLVQRQRFGSQTHERLASSPASRDGPQCAARLALPRDSSDAAPGVSNLWPPGGAMLGESIAAREGVLLHYRDPRGPTPTRPGRVRPGGAATGPGTPPADRFGVGY